MWWKRSWDLYNRSRVWISTCTSCKSLGQSGFYSLTWAYKVRFLKGEVSSNSKKKNSKIENYRLGLIFKFNTRMNQLFLLYLQNITRSHFSMRLKEEAWQRHFRYEHFNFDGLKIQCFLTTLAQVCEEWVVRKQHYWN